MDKIKNIRTSFYNFCIILMKKALAINLISK